MELAPVIYAGEPFVKATYILEGDGLLVFSAYSTLQALSTAAAQRNYPNVAAQAHALVASAASATWAKRSNGVIKLSSYFSHLLRCPDLGEVDQ